MPMTSSRLFAGIALLGIALLLEGVQPTRAQALPTRPIVIISPYAGGGSTDFSLRTIARKMEELGKVTVIIESRPGGAGTIAAQVVKGGATDGTNLLLADVGTFASNVTLVPNLAYDPVKDFKPITNLWVIQNVLAVPIDSPANSLKELVELSKAKDGGLNYASPAVGSSSHLLGSMLVKMTGASMTNVPYRGALAAAADVAAGRVDFCFCSYSTIRGLVEGKKLKLLTIAATQRDPILPDVPTTAEAGYPGLEMDVWFGIVAPARTPDETVNALNELLVKSSTSEDVVAKLREHAQQVKIGSPAEFKFMIESEIRRYRPIVLDSGAQIK